MVSYFTEKYSIERYSTWTRGEAGQRIQTWSTHIDVLGSFQQRTGNKAINTSEQDFMRTFILYTEVADIVDSDRIVDVATTGRIYEILTVKNLAGHHLEIDCDIVDKNSTKA